MSVADRVIRKRLNDELDAQPWAHLLPQNIVVENGATQSDEDRRAIRLAAENTGGVKAVEDHLSVAPFVSYRF